ncbi:MAG: cell division protease FtsH [Planctomycetota bacterium]|jgi:cell division protease FtsH
MSNGNTPPPSDPGKNDNKDGGQPPRPKNFAGVLLIGLVLLIVWMVVKSNFQEPLELTSPELLEYLAKGQVEELKIEQNAIIVQLKKAPKNSQTKKATVVVPSQVSSEWADRLTELQSLGTKAARNAELADDKLLQLATAADKPGGIAALDFAVHRRYVLNFKDTDYLLVRMTEPPVASEDSVTGSRVDNERGQQVYLFQPKTFPTGDSKLPVRIGFNRLLELTNTDVVNARLGLPSPGELTIDLGDTKGKLNWATSPGLWEGVLIGLLPWVLIIAFLWFFVFRQMRGNGVGGNVLSFGKSRARMSTHEKSTVTFNDVAGVDEAKAEVGEVVEFLKHPGKFARLGGRTPRGLLLVGPPGTGKTLLAKAIAGEAEVPFYSISGSDFVEMFVGVGASRVRDLFKQARENSPCIIFLDEIDAVGRRRGAGLGGGHDEREQTLNAILVEMDGFETDTGIIVIAATNRADVLDAALLRPGRFDRQISVDLPDVGGREAILRVHGRKVRLHPTVDLGKIARGTPGFSGAELEAIVNEAAIVATLAQKDYVFEDDLEEARDRVRWGRAKTSRIMDEQEQKVTAYHEAGHTLISILTPGADPIHKVTIVPRGQALGATMYLPEKDSYSITVGKATTHLKICFGGRIAEELFFDDYTSGASNDIKQATSIARSMVREWGMSEKLGPVSYEESQDTVFIGRDLGRQAQFSEATVSAIDTEVKRIISEAYDATRVVLAEHKDELAMIAEALLEYEVLTREEVEGLMAGESVEAVRERQAANRAAMEATSEETPLSQPAPASPAEPEPKLPPGLAGEGA